ncbi:MAG TPA: nucleotidyltransferase domain-containing protein [Candidatus Altiarchaeales archaeon]|nr:nucleotidyltransferase domain-containing protein [Candidatus Altiarchaeales archaeon]
MDQKLLRKIEKDFQKFKKDIDGILLFGSYSTGDETPRSDIDICLIIGKRNPKEIFDKILESRLVEKYDIKIFETLPLAIKGEILEHGIVVWARDRYELSYYLYKWKRDMARSKNSSEKAWNEDI